METIFTPNAPKPGGHYSQAVVHNNMIYVSGQLPIDPKTGEKKTGTIEEQTELVLHNMSEIVTAAGSDINRVIKVTLYISDVRLWNQVNQVYARFFGDHRPARAIVPVSALHYGYQIELEAIAAIE